MLPNKIIIDNKEYESSKFDESQKDIVKELIETRNQIIQLSNKVVEFQGVEKYLAGKLQASLVKRSDNGKK